MRVFRVGELQITRVLELEFPLPRAVLLVGQDPEALSEACGWAKPHFLTPSGDIVFALTAHALVSQGRRIVIDPCCSFDLRRRNPDIADRARFLLDEQLPAAGYSTGEIDLVLNSHLDGVGWNVRPASDASEGWVPAFPNASCIWTKEELARVDREDASDAEVADAASLAPLRDAGCAVGVEPTYRVTDEVSFRPSPGHTSGNVDIWIESQGECAVLVGDHILNPIQCAEPDWSGLDARPEDSPQIRRALLDECVERDALVIGPHFGTPGAGRVRRDGEVFRLEALSA